MDKQLMEMVGLVREAELANNEANRQDALNQFIEEYIENRYCLELLRFWGAHPRARFNRLVFGHALNESGHKSEFERAVIHLIDKGVIQVTIENGTHLYSLTEDEPIRSQVLELAGLVWHCQPLALKRVHPFITDGRSASSRFSQV